MTLEKAITNNVSKFKRIITNNLIVIYFSYIYLIIDEKRSFNIYKITHKFTRLI